MSGLQLINNSTEDTITELETCFVSVYLFLNINLGLRFSKRASALSDLKVGNKIQFVNDDRFWYFFNTDDQDGYSIRTGSGKHGGWMVNDNSLVYKFCKSVNADIGDRFLVKKTNSYFKDNRLFEIVTSSTTLNAVALLREEKEKRMDFIRTIKK